MTRFQGLAAGVAGLAIAMAAYDAGAAQGADFIPAQFRMAAPEAPAAATAPTRLAAARGAALGQTLAAPESTARFYALRDGAPAFVERDRLNDAGREALATLNAAWTHALNPAAYHGAALAAAFDGRGRLIADDAAAADVLLADATILYARDMLNGRVDAGLGDDVAKTQETADEAALLQAVLARRDVAGALESLAPAHPQYRLLQREYLRWLDAAEGAAWPVVANGGALKPGAHDPRVAQLRARLDAEDAFAGRIAPPRAAIARVGDGAADADLYDDALKARVEAFQRHAGLAVDGVIGPRTLALLNQGPEARARVLALNMDRWRWLPNRPAGRYVLVNAPQYRLTAYEADGREALSMDVIVGRAGRETPQFSDRIRYMVVNPDWSVPASIAVKDKLPVLQRDPGYFNRLGYVIRDASGARVDPHSVNWSAYSRSNFPFRLTQLPGPANALGTVKFMFPNAHNVYLHDTDNPDLFVQDSRGLSSGCVRVGNPRALARWLADGDASLRWDAMETAWAGDATQTLNLADPVPVHLAYFTAWAGEDGAAFFDDIYGRDDRLIAALDGAS